MGIRFYCPNGHKLNVKEFQAGRTGICPVCGEKMQIPLRSVRPSTKQDQEQEYPMGGGALLPRFSNRAARQSRGSHCRRCVT